MASDANDLAGFNTLPEAALVSAGDFLAKRGLFGFAWLDGDLVVRRTYGKLAKNLQIGKPITQSMLALIGIESEIQALVDEPGSMIVLANVAVDPSDDDAWRLNIAVYRTQGKAPFLVLLSQLLEAGTMERQLNQQIRKVRLAEERIVAQAREIERANGELQRANGELEEFAYIISHDLQGPLRALREIGSDLLAAPPQPDPADFRTGIADMIAQSRRMSKMLTGLLTYAAIGRKADGLEEIETRALAEDIVARLQRAGSIAFSIDGDWPRLTTLPVPLDVVLRNLVDNAVKHHDRPRGAIRLAAENAGAMTVFSVGDDGPGIPAEWHEAVFVPFRKIDDAARPDSSGIGLSLVKKTVTVVGGRIEIVSDPAVRRGTSFRVYWPNVIVM